MNAEYSSRVTAHHLQRDAYLYIRQSTLRQVLEGSVPDLDIILKLQITDLDIKLYNSIFKFFGRDSL